MYKYKNNHHLKPPKGLSGRALGMFYKNRQKMKSAQKTNVSSYESRTDLPRSPSEFSLENDSARLETISSSSESNADLTKSQSGLNLESESARLETNAETKSVCARPRPPKGCRGKALGLFHKNRRRTKNEEEEKFKMEPPIDMPSEKIIQIEYLLNLSSEVECERVSHEFKERFTDLRKTSFEQFILNSNDLGVVTNCQINDKLKTTLINDHCSIEYKNRLKSRTKLPALMLWQNILNIIEENQIVLIVGSTGCGKTTQVPQIILDEYIMQNQGSLCKIVCTQPRRISAITVAERVAYERCEELGSSVGYQIRLECKMPRSRGSILFCTTGVLLQRMQSDPLLLDLSHLILDEIHERSVETDLLMALLKKILPYRPDLKIILMSATVSHDVFRQYFSCNYLEIEGSMFPVEVKYVEDILQETGYKKQNTTSNNRRRKLKHSQKEELSYEIMIKPYLTHIKNKYRSDVLHSLKSIDSEGVNLDIIEFLIWYICENKPNGAVLVFLPGYDSISKLHTNLKRPNMKIGNFFADKIEVYALHSMMSTVDQKQVFLPPTQGKRKIILSTNIAETSITINDVVYVINSGKSKQTKYNLEDNLQILEENWTTLANNQQRKGRAGRIQPGICYNIFSKARENTMDLCSTPEILTTKLDSVLLSLKLLHVNDVTEFMCTLIDVPAHQAIQNGIALLQRINALDEKEIITPLGMHLARLPVDPQIGKMMLLASLFKCVDPITTISAAISFKSPFYSPLGLEKQVDKCKCKFADSTKSDHFMLDHVMLAYREAKSNNNDKNFCYENFLSSSVLKQIERMKNQFTELLYAVRLVESSDCSNSRLNVNANNIMLMRAVVAGGLYPNIAYVKKSRFIKSRNQIIHSIFTLENRRVLFHPSSINNFEACFDSSFFVYFLKQKTSNIFLFDTTMVYPMALILFGDRVMTGTANGRNYITAAKDYWFQCNEKTAEVLLRVRHRIEVLMQKKALYPSPITEESNDNYLIKAIELLLSQNSSYETYE